MDLNPSLKTFVNARVDAALKAAGHSQLMTNAAKREAAAWVRTRGALASRRKGLLGGWAVVWTDAGHGTVELKPVDVPVAGPGEVTIETAFSTVSPGTERAYYLRLPNARPHIPHQPGYTLAGRVVAAGDDVDLREGDLVAATGVGHASVVTALAGKVYRVPDGLDPAAAATTQLGVISGQGVALADLRPGEAGCVIGAGAIGILAQRIATAKGAGPITVVASSRRRERTALEGGAAEFRTTAELGDRRWPLVFEVTGNPAALHAAIEATEDGGRVVLLGSTRGRSDALPLGLIRDRGIELIGAHVNTLMYEQERTGRPAEHDVGDDYLRLLSDGAVDVSDFVRRRLDPREAEIFYRELAADGDVLGAVYDWSLLPEGERVVTRSPLRLPDITGRGKDPVRRLSPPMRGRSKVSSVTPAPAPAPAPDAGTVLRYGIVGCGDIAVINAGAIAAAANAQLTACFDPDTALAEDLALAHDGAAVSPSYEALLERDDVDVVFISVPHHLHAPLAVAAARAGKHIVVEKPPANNLQGSIEMVEAAEAAGVALSICFPQRYQPDVVAARHLIERGALGEIAGATAELLMDRSPAYRLSGFSGRSQSDWRNSREQAGGGVLIMNLSHYVDLLHHLTGLVATEVTALGGGLREGIEDSIVVQARLSNGGLVSITGSTEVRGSVFTQMRVWGPYGQITTEHDPRFYTLKSVDDLRTTRWQKLGDLSPVNIRERYVSEFGTAVAAGTDVPISGRDCLQTQAFIEAVYRSIDAGGPVEVQALFDGAAA